MPAGWPSILPAPAGPEVRLYAFEAYFVHVVAKCTPSPKIV